MTFDLERQDTICAPATGDRPAALAIVRVSGRDAPRIRDVVFRPRHGGQPPTEPAPFQMVLGEVIGPKGELVDEAFCCSFPEGRSYTGEHSFELTLHGSPLRVKAALAALTAAGCRLAEPGELTLRAHLNGRLDLVQAEAVHDVIGAKTEAAAQAALRQLAGELGTVIEPTRSHLVSALAELEARLDYPDEDLPSLEVDRVVGHIASARGPLERLVDGAALGRRLTEGARIVLFGQPNAGKSTLLNALVGEERAIVHESPGTTRDVLEAQIDLEGIPCTLVDVAGVRELPEGRGDPAAAVEALGIERARAELDRADVVVVVRPVDVDTPVGLPGDVAAPQSGAPVVHVRSKSDLASELPSAEGEIVVSAHTGRGIQELEQRIAGWLRGNQAPDEVLLTHERHRLRVERAIEALGRAQDALRASQPDEVVCAELRRSGSELDALLGKDLGEDVLDEVFSRFCIGK